MTRLGLIAALLGACSSFCAAANAEPSAPRGLPRLNVAALAVSAERLYVGGFDQGLFVVEADGQARPFVDAALSPHINALVWSEPEQVLWLGTARGLVRCQMAPQPSCGRVGGSSAVHAVLLRADGTLVAGGDAGLAFVGAGSTRVFGKKQSAPFRSVWALAEADGALFVGSTNGLFWGPASAFNQGGRLKRAAIVVGDLPDDWVTALLPRGGSLHVGTYNAGLVSFRRQGAELVPAGADAAPGYVNPQGLLALDETRVAVATMAGLRSGLPARTSLVAARGRDVTAVAKAVGGGFWLGTRQGLEWSALTE